MAQAPSPLRLSKESYPDAPEWFTRFLDTMNPFLTDTSSLLAGSITKENLRRQVEKMTITTTRHLEDTFSGGKLSIKNRLAGGGKPDSVVLAQVTGGTGANLNYGTEDWMDPALLNSWVYYGSPFSEPAYYMDAAGRVHLRGLLKDGTVVPGDVLFTLPAGYIPPYDLIFPAPTFGGTCEMRVRQNGDVVCGAIPPNPTYVSLDGISFRSEGGSGIGVGLPQWEYTQTGLVKINYIPGLRPLTKYDLTFVIE